MGMGSSDFIQSVKNDQKQGEVLDWKDEGSVVIFIHPSGFRSRYSIWLPVIAEEGKNAGKVVNRRFNSPRIEGNCPVAEFRQFLRDNEDIDDDDIVFTISGKGGKVELSKGDVLGLKGYDWKNSLKETKEYVMLAVDTDNIEAGLQVLVTGPAPSGAISKVIKNQIKDEGEEEGDPLKNPYAIKLEYDENEVPMKMYSAFYHKHKYTDEIKELLESVPAELDNFLQPSDPAELWEQIKDSIVVSGFEPSVLEMIEDKGSKEDKKEEEKKQKQKKEKKEEKKEEKAEQDKKPKKGQKKVVKQEEKKEEEKKKEPEEEQDVCPACDGAIAWDATSCPHCNVEFDIVEEGEEEKKEEESKKDSGTVTCPECKAENPDDAKRCESCGEKLK